MKIVGQEALERLGCESLPVINGAGGKFLVQGFDEPIHLPAHLVTHGFGQGLDTGAGFQILEFAEPGKVEIASTRDFTSSRSFLVS